MPRVQERRRHDRAPLVCPATLKDKTGRVLLRGRTADISPGGIRLIGPGRLELHSGQACWVELSVPNPASRGSPRRLVKLKGEIRRVSDLGEWKSVGVVLENNFTKSLLAPIR
jgi:c-di-GMP-binding flagellar brake protein YcgR